MRILDDLISTLDFSAPVKDIRQGVFYTAVMSRYCGLAATLAQDAFQQGHPPVAEPGFLLDRNPHQLACMAHSESILEAAIGMATINSLLEVDDDACIELNAADLILEKGAGKKVAIVGHFPFIPRISKKAETLWVIEKNPKEGDFHETDADRLLPQAEVVAITGTALTNHTLEHLLALCAPKCYVMMLGGTVPLSPVLFEYGIDALSGAKVINPELALQGVSQSATFRQIKGTRLLTMMKT